MGPVCFSDSGVRVFVGCKQKFVVANVYDANVVYACAVYSKCALLY